MFEEVKGDRKVVRVEGEKCVKGVEGVSGGKREKVMELWKRNKEWELGEEWELEKVMEKVKGKIKGKWNGKWELGKWNRE